MCGGRGQGISGRCLRLTSPRAVPGAVIARSGTLTTLNFVKPVSVLMVLVLALGACTGSSGPGLETTMPPQSTVQETSTSSTTITVPERPNLAAGATATASQSLPGQPPAWAIDGDTTSQWESGSEPTQWIELDLGKEVEIGEIVLIVAQSSGGITRHLIDVDGERVWAFENDTGDEDVLTYSPETPLDGQLIRITTISSPGQVAWREIEVRAP